jgi:hypothetical protein
MVGKVQRLLKKNAWDCNLELEAITFSGLPPRVQIDAQGQNRRSLLEDGTEMDGYSINDVDYTTYCDYQVCRHECAVSIADGNLQLDASTFSVADARRLIIAKQVLVRRLFDDQVMVPESVVQEIFGDLPWEIASEALMELIDGRRFTLTRPDGVPGFLVKKAGFLVFQPAGVADTDIPMSLRYARGFQLRRHVMDSRMPVWGRAEEAGAAKPSAPVIVQEAPASDLMDRWATWLAFVNSNGSTGLPAGMSSTLRLWAWILARYAGVPETRQVALRWWIDKCTPAEQRTLLETAAPQTEAGDPVVEGLQATLSSEIFRSKQLVSFRLFNPETIEVQIFSKPVAGGSWGPATSTVAGIVDKSLGNTAVPIPAGTGPLIGFIAAKQGRSVFKSLDTTKPRKHSSVGVECGNTSTLGMHRPGVQALHAAARSSDLAPLMLPDSDDTWNEAAAKTHMAAVAPEHLRDLTHQPLCLYLEFLTRILDARHLGPRRIVRLS